MKTLYIDVETTGLDPKRHGIIQLSGFIVQNDGTRCNDFNFRMRPFGHQEIDQSALDANGVTREQIMEYEAPEKAFKQFLDILSTQVDKFNSKDKYYFKAYNAPFDSEFVRAFFLNNADKFYGSWFWTPALCIMQLAGWIIPDRAKMENFKLGTVAAHLGIEVAKEALHDGLYDINLAYEVEQKLIGLR